MNIAALLGLLIMVVSEGATLARIEPFYSWNTPIAWSGFILFADSVVWKARRHSWLRSRPAEFAFLAVASVPLWLVFEFYNLFIDNWYYTGLPRNFWLRQFGYAWSFATIWPAIFEAADLIDVWRAPASGIVFGKRYRYILVNGAGYIFMITAGCALLLWPLVWPSPYLAAPVFLGFIFLLDPINARAGDESFSLDLRARRYDRLINLLVAGFICGGLWEFWNFWARAKWIYTVPIFGDIKIFEMPVLGYFGFPPFALECFTMYVFARRLVWRGARRPIGV